MNAANQGLGAAEVVNPSLWAEVGGLNGLVIFALFMVLYVVAKVFAKALENILNNHRSDLGKIMDLHAREREEWGQIVDTRQKETNEVIKTLTAAVNKMAVRHRADDVIS